MLDIPQKIDVTHNLKLSVYEAEKNTVFGMPVPGLVVAAVAIVAAVWFIKSKSGKKSRGK